MKTILLFLAISMLTCTESFAQEMKYFKTKESESIRFYPKMDTIPADFINQAFSDGKKNRTYISEVLQNVTKKSLSTELAQRIIGKRVLVMIYLNAFGEVFYLNFTFPRELKSFVQESDLLKLYQGFRAIRFDMSQLDTTPMTLQVRLNMAPGYLI